MINTNFMKTAIEIANKSGKDMPIGAVIIFNDKIIAQAHNEKEIHQQVSKHAEMIVLEKANSILNNWRLEDCTLYVTLEPCPMCAWAILQSRIKEVYFGSYDPLYGALGSRLNLQSVLNSKTIIKGGILEAECDNLLKQYFEKMRNDNKTKS